jgi:hypothetical protein
MKGVWNYAGYLVDGKAYVILLNQAANRRNDVLALLQNGGAENVVRKSVKRKVSQAGGS